MSPLVKVRRGWYCMGGLHFVRTERYGKDRALDWVAVRDEARARSIYNGGKVEDIVAVHNTLRALVRTVRRSREAARARGERGAYMDPMTIEGTPGEHITQAAKRAVAAAETAGEPVVLAFNGVRVEVAACDFPDDVVARWSKAMDDDARAYCTPDRIAARDRQHESDRADLKWLIEKLDDGRDLSDARTAILWLCRLEETAKTHTPYDSAAVVARFEAAGWKVNVMCLDEGETTEQGTERVGIDGQRAWLIGQALDGVLRVGAPDKKIHRFAADLGL